MLTAGAEPEELPSEVADDEDELVAGVDDLVQLVALVVLDELHVFHGLLLGTKSSEWIDVGRLTRDPFRAFLRELGGSY